MKMVVQRAHRQCKHLLSHMLHLAIPVFVMEVVCVPMGKHICKATGYCAEGECMEEGGRVS